MKQEIRTIRLPMPLRLGSVNCYLVNTGSGYILIDTGGSNSRAAVDQALHDAGCTPGSLHLILLTHGDFDHTGNAAYLRQRFGSKVAMHRDDVGMLKQGDMFYNRKGGNRVIRMLAPILFRFGKENRLQPDVLVEDGFDLSPYRFDARIVHIPGHSAGSVGILTAGGDLICGDLLECTKTPALGSIMDDPETARASVEKLNGLGIQQVYPGHGESFGWHELPFQSSGAGHFVV
ncbi:MAG: MBL fold metallo-hydrolase [Anaerolineae bacterium]|nr:MBL fold metallo-hydrolase [Anaerolineae bacterium]